MQSVADYMQELFDTRIAEEKTILANRASYRQKFFSADCLWDSRRFTLEMIESERIVSIEDLGSQTLVITEYTASASPPSARTNRRRYHLKIQDDNFKICCVEALCAYCHGSGDESCMMCKGKHWI
jgi:hypothetical protein